MYFFMPEIPLPLQKVKAELCAGINEGNKLNRTTSHYYYILSTRAIFLALHHIGIIDEFGGQMAVKY